MASPKVGDAAILYGTPCEVLEVTTEERTRVVARRRVKYEQELVHLNPGLTEPLVLEAESFYKIASGEWTTPGRLLSKDERRAYKKQRNQSPVKNEGGEEGAREFLLQQA